jgi:putative transposase
MSDEEWKIIEPKLPAPKGFGRPREVDLREIINAIFYVQRTGCQWEMLPHDFPPHQTVYKYFHKWQRKGIWQKIHDELRQEVRKKMGRAPDSSVAMADSQSVKTTEKRERYMALMVARKLKDVNGIS